jgi:hypothetical protein
MPGGAWWTWWTSGTNTTPGATCACVINQLENEIVKTCLIETGAPEFIFNFFA